MHNVNEKLELSAGEQKWRRKQLADGRYVATRWQVSPTQSDQASRHMLGLIELRLHASLMVAKRCNDDLGEESPYKDDALLKAHPERANLDCFLEALRRAKDGTRPSARGASERPKPERPKPEPTKPEPIEPAPLPEVQWQSDFAMPPAPVSPKLRDNRPARSVVNNHLKWTEDFAAWRAAGDITTLLPELPQDVFEDIKKRAPVEPRFKQVYEDALKYNRAREEQLAGPGTKQDKQEENKHQAQGGAEPATGA
jgi:hypothetical protein